MMKKIIIPLAALVGAVLTTACEVEDPSAKNLSQSEAPATVSGDAKAPAKKKDAGPKLTSAQENAIDKANDYLGYEAFSRKGLIEQLKYEGFKEKLATFAVDYIHPNWNQQAAKKAKDYLGYDSFSRSGLIEQLEYEGFTHAQAVFGVNHSGL